MFINLDKKNPDAIAIIDSLGFNISYGELCAFAEEFKEKIGKRALFFILCENCAGALAGYVAGLSQKIVPVMLSAGMDRQLLDRLIEQYQPAFLWMPEAMAPEYAYPSVFSKYAYTLLETQMAQEDMYDDLSLLLTTSGSTGSPKFVRHSYKNVEANARNIADVFGMDENERGMVSLPLQFTQGLNVATSHLFGGSVVLLTPATLTQREFWSFFKEQRATSFTGVPYSYEVLDKLRFFRMDLPHLKTINQGGGRLTNELFMKCARFAHDTGRRFVATYGATETTARMAYLPPELAMQKCGSIGKPIPEGRFVLTDEDGGEIKHSGDIGEIVYSGPNVTLGYAECRRDLAKGDDRGGVYATGDMARRDEDGCYFIVGRKKRFLKLFGYRIGLDETERLIKSELGIACACTGSDKKMMIYITDADKQDDVAEYISRKTGIHASAFDVMCIKEIPKNEAGKTLYNKLG